jgi:hypothetical protein
MIMRKSPKGMKETSVHCRAITMLIKPERALSDTELDQATADSGMPGATIGTPES